VTENGDHPVHISGTAMITNLEDEVPGAGTVINPAKKHLFDTLVLIRAVAGLAGANRR
jgi:hypothetical protein